MNEWGFQVLSIEQSALSTLPVFRQEEPGPHGYFSPSTFP